MKKNILIVDDSALMRRVLSDTVNSDERYQVKDIANNGEEGLKLILANPSGYDAVLLDIYMPKMTGLELLMELEKKRGNYPRIVICSTKADESAEETMIALEHGAFDFIKKPENLINAKSNTFKEALLTILEVATESRPKRSILSTRQTPAAAGNVVVRTSATKPSTLGVKSPLRVPITAQKGTGNKLIALACSTGGPKTLQSVIPLLPEGLNAPMVLVQHMPKGFTKSLAMRLNDMSKVKVKEAAEGDVLQKGCVYIAPGGSHLKVAKIPGGGYKAVISDEPPRDALKPCANIMYESLVGSAYDEIVCVVLTGMGADGTEGIKTLKKRNKVYVISQDEETCVVYGMPKMVAQAGLSDEVLPITEVANSIIKKVGVQ